MLLEAKKMFPELTVAQLTGADKAPQSAMTEEAIGQIGKISTQVKTKPCSTEIYVRF